MNQSNNNKKKGRIPRRVFMALVWLVSGIIIAHAQPSGGPYGPVLQNYELPKVTGKIFYVAPEGNEASQGDQLSLPTTLEHALAAVHSGDAIILRGGTYRTGDLEFNQGITIQPYANEQPVLKGTLVVKEWTRISGNLWKTPWKTFFRDSPDGWWNPDRFGMKTPLHIFNNDMVFKNGKALHSAGWEGEVDESSFYIDYRKGFVYIGFNPEKQLIEITAHNRGLYRVTKELHGLKSDQKGVVMRGIVLTQYAFCAFEIEGTTPEGLADPATFGKDVVGSVIEHCTFSFCGRVGAHLKGDNLVLRNCKVHDTTTEGIYLMSSSDCLLERNMFSRNNVENIAGYYPAAVKIFNQTHRVTCRDNLIYDLPLSNGIWYDVGNVDGRFINNRVKDVGTNRGKMGDAASNWPNYNGFFFEISKGAVCAGNVFENCDQGIFILNSSNVEVFQNTFVNSTVCFGRDTRSAAGDHFGWHPSTGPGVEERHGHVFVNNLLSGNAGYEKPLMVVYQHRDLCGKLKESPLKQFDYNVFVKDANSGNTTLLTWSPAPAEGCQQAVETLDEMKKIFDGSSANSLVLEKPAFPLFLSSELGNYRLNKAFPGANNAVVLPDNIQKMLGLSPKYKPYSGAYPAP
jgi:parallel beta-helix repeat protein